MGPVVAKRFEAHLRVGPDRAMPAADQWWWALSLNRIGGPLLCLIFTQEERRANYNIDWTAVF